MVRKGILLFVLILVNYALYAQLTQSKSLYFLEQDFNSGFGQWTVVDSNEDGYTWKVETSYQQKYSLDGSPFAFVNSDSAGNVMMDEFLISPKVDVSTAKNLYLSFDYFFNVYSGGTDEVADVDVWDGTNWVNVFRKTEDSGDIGYWEEPAKALINVSAYKNDSFQIRFHYYNANDDFYWAVDNVKLFEKDSFDVALVSFSTFPKNEIVRSLGPVRFKLGFSNEGLNDVDTVFYGVRVFSVDGSLVFKANDTLKSSLPVGQVFDTVLQTEWTPQDSGRYMIEPYVSCTGDKDSTNNKVNYDFYVFPPQSYESYIYTFVAKDADASGDMDYLVGLEPKSGLLAKTFTYSKVLLTDGDFIQDGNLAYLLALGNDTTVYFIFSDKIYPLGKVQLIDSTEQLPLALTYDSYHKQVYLLFFDRERDSNVVYKLDLASLKAQKMFTVKGPNALSSFAADTLGRLWAIDISGDSLYQISLATGKAISVGKLGLDVNYLSGLDFERETNKFYALLYDNTQGKTVLGLLDTTNAALQTIQILPDIYSLCAVNAKVEPEITGVFTHKSVKVYPNPTYDNIFISGAKGETVIITNLQGRVLFRHRIEVNFYQVSMGNYSPGVYILRICDGRKYEVFKILKVK